MQRLENEIKVLEDEKLNLDNWNEELKLKYLKLIEDQEFKDYGYFTYNDIKELTKGEDANFIAIRAPNGTTVELPDSNNVERLREETLEVCFI